MDALGESVNWSRIAAQAFERELASTNEEFLRSVKDGVQEATAKPGAKSLDYLLDMVREKRPELVEPIREDLGPFLERVADRTHIIEGLADDPEIQVLWPIVDAETFVQNVQQQIARYHSKVVEPLIAEITGQMVLRRLAEIAEKHRSPGKRDGQEKES